MLKFSALSGFSIFKVPFMTIKEVTFFTLPYGWANQEKEEDKSAFFVGSIKKKYISS